MIFLAILAGFITGTIGWSIVSLLKPEELRPHFREAGKVAWLGVTAVWVAAWLAFIALLVHDGPKALVDFLPYSTGLLVFAWPAVLAIFSPSVWAFSVFPSSVIMGRRADIPHRRWKTGFLSGAFALGWSLAIVGLALAADWALGLGQSSGSRIPLHVSMPLYCAFCASCALVAGFLLGPIHPGETKAPTE